MSDPADLEQELAMWGKRLGYDPSFVDPHEPLMNKIDYSRQLQGEKQIDPPRLEDNTIFNEICENCCKEWLVITVSRKKKWIAKGDDFKANVRNIRFNGDGDWYVTSGSLVVEKWSDETGSTREAILNTGSVERGGPGTLTANKSRMIPAGTYQLSAWEKSHSTSNYGKVNKKPLPGVNISGNGVSSGRGINMHSAGNWAYSIGCILPVPEEHITNPSENPPTSTMTNLAPIWRDNMILSHNNMVSIINSIKNHTKMKNPAHNQYFPCVKLIITDPVKWQEEIVERYKPKPVKVTK